MTQEQESKKITGSHIDKVYVNLTYLILNKSGTPPVLSHHDPGHTKLLSSDVITKTHAFPEEKNPFPVNPRTSTGNDAGYTHAHKVLFGVNHT